MLSSDIAEFIQPRKAAVIVGGQFGSEAKGMAAAVAAMYSGTIHRRNLNILATTNAGAQAGHTTVLADGRSFVCYHLPTIGVLVPWSRIYLNAGSIIDPALLTDEIINVANAVGQDPNELMQRIIIHPNAAIIHDFHKKMEKGETAGTSTTHLGSTQKGVGAALRDKIMRRREAIAMAYFDNGQWRGRVRVEDPMHLMENGWAVTVEVPQGTGLSINAAKFYPHCTSRDCWVGQGLTDAAINPHYLGNVMMVCRTFPIRVGHIYNSEGHQIGDSGPFYEDSQELDWSDLPGVTPELTTVTKRQRRIATWSGLQYRDALKLNRPDIVMHTFINYLDNSIDFQKWMHRVRSAEADANVRPSSIWSWGPGVNAWTDDEHMAQRHAGRPPVKEVAAE